jgi:hypothetical protein
LGKKKWGLRVSIEGYMMFFLYIKINFSKKIYLKETRARKRKWQWQEFHQWQWQRFKQWQWHINSSSDSIGSGSIDSGSGSIDSGSGSGSFDIDNGSIDSDTGSGSDVNISIDSGSRDSGSGSSGTASTVAVASASTSTVTVAVAAVAVALSPAVSEWHRQWLWHPRVPGSVPQPFPQLDNLIRVLGKNSASQGISVIVLVNFIANLGFCWWFWCVLWTIWRIFDRDFFVFN